MLRRGNREIWGLVALFTVFLASALYYERVGQEVTPRDTPSSFNVASPGVKALYLLLDSFDYRTARLTSTLDTLGEADRLAIFIEPFSRHVHPEEIAALRRWVEAGGSALYFVTSPPRPLDPADKVFGDVAVVEGSDAPEALAPDLNSTPLMWARTDFMREVTRIAVQSQVRLKPAANSGYEPLLHDKQGALILHKTVGRGHLLIAANSKMITNAGIREADNVVFLVNVAAVTTGAAKGVVQFDEYHHGVGFARAGGKSGGGLLENIPLPARLALWQLAALGALLLYNGNRRFGQARTLRSPAYRPSTDYVGSMARLYRRAGAADIALATLYKSFLRDLARQLDTPADTPLPQLCKRAEQKFKTEGDALAQTLRRCEEVVAGRRIGDAEMLGLTQKIEHYRRSFHLDGRD
jgi:hypothetical protein